MANHDTGNHDEGDPDTLGVHYLAQTCPEDGEYLIADRFLCIVDVQANLAAIADDRLDTASIQTAGV